MAKRKTAPAEDPGMEESTQSVDEMPGEEDTQTVDPADRPDGEWMPDTADPPGSTEATGTADALDAAEAPGTAEALGGDPTDMEPMPGMADLSSHWESDAPVGEQTESGMTSDPDAGEASDGSTVSKERDADPQYETLLQEVGSASPIPPTEDGEQGEEAPPPMEEPAGDLPPVGTEWMPDPAPLPVGPAASADDPPGDTPLLVDAEKGPPAPEPSAAEPPAAGETPSRRAAGPRRAPAQHGSSVLTIDARDRVQTQEEQEEALWHEVRNAYRTRRILTGILGGVEQTKAGRTLAIVDYKGFRVAIPILEMMLYTGEMPSNRKYVELMGRLNRALSTMLGAEIDFIVKGIDSNTRSIVASRKDAMLRKRQIFYMDTDELGEHLIYEGRVVQARVIAVAEKVIRVEAFGVECAIMARDLSWEWLGDARDHFSVGSRILIRVRTIDRGSLEQLSITADVRSVSSTTNLDNVKKCQPQCRYAGKVTDVRGGVVYIRLNNGVNAIAHSCYDRRTPGKKDDVSFAVTRLDEERGVAIGIITRIIKQNL